MATAPASNVSMRTRYSPLTGHSVHEMRPIPQSCLLVEKVRLTAADLVTIYSAGKLVIPAPGAGASIFVDQVVTRYVSDGIAFTNTGNDFFFRYGSASDGTNVNGSFSISDSDAGVSGTVNQTYCRTLASSRSFVDDDNINKSLYLRRTTSNLTNTGSTASYLDMYIFYYIIQA